MSDNILKIGLGDVIERSYLESGRYSNTMRHLPLLLDGLKPAYRRVIYASYLESNDFVKTARIIGSTIGRFHPHGDMALIPVVSRLVRFGVFDGQGNHGSVSLMGESLDEAAPRYTEVKLKSQYRELINLLIKYVPHRPNYDNKETEPEYLPTPVPIALTIYGSFGIGIGINTRIPVFDIKSLYRAMIKDDPFELEAPDGLTLDKERSELDKLWKTGKGRLTYKLEVIDDQQPDAFGYSIQGSPYLFTPDLSTIMQWRSEELVFVRDSSSGKDKKLFIARNPRIRKVTDDDIWEELNRVSYYTKHYALNVTDEEKFFLVPLREWLRLTYDNYINLLNKYRESNINNILHEIEVANWTPKIVQYLIDNQVYENEEICKALNVDKDIVTSVLRKSLSTLKKSESADKIAALEAKLEEFKSMNSKEKVEQIINKF